MLIAAVALFVRFGLGGPEDTWICQDGQWVKPGEASGPMQNGACPGELMTVQLFFNNSRFDPEYSFADILLSIQHNSQRHIPF